jgi:ribosomal protein S18 acetylase RimI-like enzyme
LHTSETDTVEYITSKGFTYVDSTLRMTYDLSKEPAPLLSPNGIKVKNWKIEKEAEQVAYVAARNEAFPLTPIRLIDAQMFLRSIINKSGTTVTAFDGKEIVGAVNAYWIEDEIKLKGKATAWTENIFVRKAWEGRGVASYLIYLSLIYLKKHDMVEARLDTGSENKRAQAVYTRLGYKITGEKRQYALNFR